MNIDLLFQIAGVGILIFAVNQVLQKAGREDIAVLASVAGLVVVMLWKNPDRASICRFTKMNAERIFLIPRIYV